MQLIYSITYNTYRSLAYSIICNTIYEHIKEDRPGAHISTHIMLICNWYIVLYVFLYISTHKRGQTWGAMKTICSYKKKRPTNRQKRPTNKRPGAQWRQSAAVNPWSPRTFVEHHRRYLPGLPRTFDIRPLKPPKLPPSSSHPLARGHWGAMKTICSYKKKRPTNRQKRPTNKRPGAQWRQSAAVNPWSPRTCAPFRLV